MKRDIVNQLIKASQAAWEKYVSVPTNENREKYEAVDDELRIELEWDRVAELESNLVSSDCNN